MIGQNVTNEEVDNGRPDIDRLHTTITFNYNIPF